jgi:hypothetical protein
MPGLASTIQRRRDLDLFEAAVGAVSLVTIMSLATALFLARHKRVYGSLALLSGLAAAGALQVWQLGTWKAFKHLVQVQGFSLPDDPWRDAAFCLVPLAAFNVLIVAALELARLSCPGTTAEIASPGRLAKRVSRGALLAGALAGAALLGPIYWHMLHGPTGAVDASAGAGVFPRLISAAEEAHALNPSEQIIDELRHGSNRGRYRSLRGQGDPPANQLEALYREIMSKLGEGGGVSFDLSKDAYFEYSAQELPKIQAMRRLMRAWIAEAEHSARLGRFDEASEYGLALVRAGSIFSRGGLPMHTVFGVVLEGAGVGQLSQVRKQVSPARSRELLQALARVDGARESIATALARDEAWSDRVGGWRIRLAFALAALTGRELDSHVSGLLRSSHDRRDTYLRLLMTDIALALFLSDQGGCRTIFPSWPPTICPVCRSIPSRDDR